MTFRAGLALGLLLATAGCLRPVGPPDCRADGGCECVKKSECPAGFDCLDGQCQLPPDASTGALGDPCDAGSQCESGRCLPPGPVNGGLCSAECAPVKACPRGWECKQPPDAGVGLCAPPSLTLCLPCQADSDCGPLADLCLPVGGARVCGRDCSAQTCPPGYACTLLARDGGLAKQCVPAAETCACTELSAGLTRPCSREADAGRCIGREECRANGSWSSCDARVPAPEICDGVDDDCDGLIDGEDPSLDTSALPASPPYPSCRKGDGGACVGEWACREFPDAGFGWSCSAADPVPESCNGRDDDCNGLIDEVFLDDAGRYRDVHHCGACGFDCEQAVPDLAADDAGVRGGAVACELRSSAPACVPKLCAAGFFPAPVWAPVTCREAVSSACRPCAGDSDCLAPFDRCVTLAQDTGTYCAQGCDVSDPYVGCTGQLGAQGCCPAGQLCQLVGAVKSCVPTGGTCSCTPERSGAVRSCFVGATASSCVGQQSCQSGPQWGGCSTTRVTQELCDGLDNNCDGLIDEPFVGTRDSGTYDADEHCGSCTGNCRALWNPVLQHAIGGCDAGPGRPPACHIARCTQESVAGGGACRLDGDCAAGRVCHPLFRQCVRACSADGDCGGNPCRGGFCTLACTSNAQCATALGAPSACDAGYCEVSYQFVDTDRDSTNGCECPRSGVPDEPDRSASYPNAGMPYVDRDCDGVDGVASRSLYVFSGSAQSLGTRGSPYRTLGEALAAYDGNVHAGILVAAGNYPEQVVLRAGVRMYGGYSADFSRRDVVANSTLIDAPEPDFSNPLARRGTVNAEAISVATVFAGFTVRGYDVTFRPGPGGSGRSSYAIYVKDSSSALVLANNRVVGGRGGDGAPGTPGNSGQGGGVGLGGLNAAECTSASCAGESQSGGAAGRNSACGANGNVGAASAGSANPQAYPSSSPLDGAGGSNANYQGSTTTGLCKNPCYMPGGTMAGGDARNGQDGTPGGAGAGCFGGTGSIVAGEWTAGAASNAQAGNRGTGGGGGGAGGCVINNTPSGCTIGNRVGDLGATGGGGGAGGCGGQPGLRGGGGGGSFGIFVVFGAQPASLPVIEGNLVEVGAGGFGGSGGAGGYGGQGGTGGEGGATVWPAWCAGSGGHGGRGGNGGAGGGGGGGCGGVAIGIAGNFLSSATYSARNSFVAPGTSAAGSPGAGGASPAGGGANGGDGAEGLAATYRAY